MIFDRCCLRFKHSTFFGRVTCRRQTRYVFSFENFLAKTFFFFFQFERNKCSLQLERTRIDGFHLLISFKSKLKNHTRIWTNSAAIIVSLIYNFQFFTPSYLHFSLSRFLGKFFSFCTHNFLLLSPAINLPNSFRQLVSTRTNQAVSSLKCKFSN